MNSRLQVRNHRKGRPSQVVSYRDRRRRPHSTAIDTKSIHEIIAGNRPNNQSRHWINWRHRNVSKPFERNRIETPSQTNIKWDDTFFDLKHSPEDRNRQKFRQGLERNDWTGIRGKEFHNPDRTRSKGLRNNVNDENLIFEHPTIDQRNQEVLKTSVVFINSHSLNKQSPIPCVSIWKL